MSKMVMVPREHVLKILPQPFDALLSGAKTGEVRDCRDREFSAGDSVHLVEISGIGIEHGPTGRTIRRTITHIQTGFGLPDNLCVLSYGQPAEQHQGEPVAYARICGVGRDSKGNTVSMEIGVDSMPVPRKVELGEQLIFVNDHRREVERLRESLACALKSAENINAEVIALSAKLAERDALLRGLVEYADGLLSNANDAWSFAGSTGTPESHKDEDYARAVALLSASAEPIAPKCKGWTCFHCQEYFTDSEAAAIHFGDHEIQRPACLIDAAEYRSMEARVRECANEDSELHRQMHHQANEHKLELRRAEESGYAKGLADASAPVEIDERAEFEAWVSTRKVCTHKGATLKKDRAGNYLDYRINGRWLTWQARAALERKP